MLSTKEAFQYLADNLEMMKDKSGSIQIFPLKFINDLGAKNFFFLKQKKIAGTLKIKCRSTVLYF